MSMFESHYVTLQYVVCKNDNVYYIGIKPFICYIAIAECRMDSNVRLKFGHHFEKNKHADKVQIKFLKWNGNI